MELLVANFNPATIPALMCRTTLSVGWDGTLYDCDFNQMLEKPAGFTEASLASAAALASLAAVEGGAIATGRHCFGCTAGSGSSCGGELQPA
jgi:hypothetical protein